MSTTVTIVEEAISVTISDGARSLALLADVTIADVADEEVLTYDAASGKWVNAPGGGGGASDVDDLTTDTGTSGDMVRVAAAGGLEYRTAAQVLSDIGASGITQLDGGAADSIYSGIAAVDGGNA